MKNRYEESEKLLERALRSIPLASQTFSKGITQFPLGAAPLFLERGEGCIVWDVDGNRYVDFINGLLSVSIGYADADVVNAVSSQIGFGVNFSLSHRLEIEVAEKIIELVPCAEKVRFGKNGSDATSAAVRLARAYTGREMVLVCGYHGWHDWYIGSTSRNLGIPDCIQALTKVFKYNDLGDLVGLLSEFDGKVAAIIMEPMNISFPDEGYLQKVKTIAKEHGVVLIFDETITGFRFSKGGAQSFFDVTPDLATLGKGLANGFPLSAVVGRSDIMSLMDRIFVSGTFSGEVASLAAAKVVLSKVDALDVPKKLFETGEYLISKLKALILDKDCSEFLSVAGHPSWSFLVMSGIGGYSNLEIKTFFMQEMLKRGVLTFGTHNMSYAHEKNHVDYLLEIYGEVLPMLKEAVDNRTLLSVLDCEPLKPLFSVR